MCFYPRTLSALAVVLTAGAVGTAAAESVRLDPITVTSPRVERDITETPQAVSVIEPEDIQDGRQQLQLDESINRVPGVFTQNRYNFAQNLRVSIRGFGARAPFGIRGVRVLVDGIPETLPDGQSQVDAIDLESVERIEVIRGPSSAIYGNAAGGVIDITTMEGPDEPYAEIRSTFGSYNFRRLGVKGGGRVGDWRGHISAWDLSYDGYREQSETRKRLVNTKGSYDIDEQRRITAVFTALDQPKGEDPAGLSRDQVREDRRQASGPAETLDAGQRVRQQRLGVIYEDAGSLPGTVTARAFYTNRDFRQQLPFPPAIITPGGPVSAPSLIRFDRDFYGVGIEYSDADSVGGIPIRYTAGVEANFQRDSRRRWNVFGTDGTRDDQTQQAVESADTVGAFAQNDFLLTDRLTLTVGGRFDRLRLKIDDRLGDGAASGRETFNELSGTAGLSYKIHPQHTVYTSVGTAFESPSFTEFYDPTEPGEGFDPGLEPQKALNFEVGAKGFLGDNARYELTAFTVETRDEIVQVLNDPDRFDNAGRTRRFGVEAGLEYFFTPRFSATGSYTWSDFRFRSLENQDGDSFRGKRLPGLPRHTFFGELAWRDPSGFYAIADTLLVSHVFGDNANDERVAGYGVVNARIGTTQQVGAVEFETFIAVNNILDKEYIENVRVNSAPNFLEPAPERNTFAGVRARF